MSLGSLNAGPENVTPNGEGCALKPAGTAAGLGKNPPGTMTLGYPARAGESAPIAMACPYLRATSGCAALKEITSASVCTVRTGIVELEALAPGPKSLSAR